jgi:hypothetical protein
LNDRVGDRLLASKHTPHALTGKDHRLNLDRSLGTSSHQEEKKQRQT